MALTCGDNGSSGQEVISQINSNTAAIAVNAGDIVVVNDKIDAINNLFDYVEDTTVDDLDLPETFTQLNSVSANLSAGKYVLSMSMTYQFDVTNKSVYTQLVFRGSTENFTREPKDTTDRIAVMYAFPFDHAGGTFSASTQVRKEDSSGTLDVFFSSLWIEKKGEL